MVAVVAHAPAGVLETISPFVEALRAANPEAGRQITAIMDGSGAEGVSGASLTKLIEGIPTDSLTTTASVLKMISSRNTKLFRAPADTLADIQRVLSDTTSGAKQRPPVSVKRYEELEGEEQNSLALQLAEEMYGGGYKDFTNRMTDEMMLFVLLFANLPIGVYAVRSFAPPEACGAGIYIAPSFQHKWGFGTILREHVFDRVKKMGYDTFDIQGIPAEVDPQIFHEKLAGRRGIAIARYRDLSSRYQVKEIDFPYIYGVRILLKEFEPRI